VDRDELLAAADRNLAFTLRHMAAAAPGSSVEDDGRLLLVSNSPSWPGPYHNGALRLDRSFPAADVLARAAPFFSGRCPGFCVWIAAHADLDLEERALAAGYASLGEGAPRMAIDHPLEPARLPEGISLEEVTDESGRTAYVGVTVKAYADELLPADAAEAQLATLPAVCGRRVRAIVARSQGIPVAGAMVLASDGVAGVQLVGTVPGARKRGLGELCTRWAVNAGFELGAAAVVLEASEMGEALYRRLGFREVSRYRWCLGPPSKGGST
jgi:ribosomal protein S18 acetylase RimI-like enzyme